MSFLTNNITMNVGHKSKISWHSITNNITMRHLVKDVMSFHHKQYHINVAQKSKISCHSVTNNSTMWHISQRYHIIASQTISQCVCIGHAYDRRSQTTSECVCIGHAYDWSWARSILPSMDSACGWRKSSGKGSNGAQFPWPQRQRSISSIGLSGTFRKSPSWTVWLIFHPLAFPCHSHWSSMILSLLLHGGVCFQFTPIYICFQYPKFDC